jgi:hypothetical protein
MINKLNSINIFEQEPKTVIKKPLQQVQYVKHESLTPLREKKELDKSKLNVLS